MEEKARENLIGLHKLSEDVKKLKKSIANLKAPRYPIHGLSLTLDDIDVLQAEIRLFQMTRARIQASPEKYKEQEHSKYFSPDEIINLKG